jgi:hypothetical protein
MDSCLNAISYNRAQSFSDGYATKNELYKFVTRDGKIFTNMFDINL